MRKSKKNDYFCQDLSFKKMKTNQDFKNAALDALSGNWGKAVLAAILYILVAMAIVGPMSFMSASANISPSATPQEMMEILTQTSGLSFATFLLEVFLLIPIEVGFANAFRKLLVLGDNNLARNVFNFSNYWRKVGAMVLVGIFTFLWTLLLVVPGIIKSFSYSMTKYIIDENPELTPSEAIHRSRMMMRGHKFDLFWLYLSFIGWAVLACLTGGIGFLWLGPYLQTSEAAFYEEVKADYAIHGGLD